MRSMSIRHPFGLSNAAGMYIQIREMMLVRIRQWRAGDGSNARVAMENSIR